MKLLSDNTTKDQLSKKVLDNINISLTQNLRSNTIEKLYEIIIWFQNIKTIKVTSHSKAILKSELVIYGIMEKL